MPNASDQPVAGIPLLATKLHVPAWRPGSVSRPRLVAALERGAGRKLTLVSAGVGFGKSTLLAEWLASDQAGDRPVAWVSLDSGDNDPALFWTYLVTALCQARPAAGEHALSLLRSPHPPPIESVLTVLINELAALEETIILVLDDLHTIESRPIHEALAFLIDRLPPSLRLVAATRADPPLPLSRYRGRGELAEVRTADLRFSPEEAAAFFNEMMGYELAVGDVAALEARTEGWIAGLQLAALSMRGQRDVAGFIRTFAGDHRYVVDYLIEEVLQRQPEDDRTFLLQTAILDRLNGPLCSAVTGQSDGGARLEALERGNFFVVPLDDTRTWYRYHHLFGDVLRARLLAEYPDLVAPLHRRASAWFERHGSTADAIRHALAGGDVERAADLVELAAPTTRRNRQEATLLGWLQSLPDEVLRRRPVLCNLYAGALMSNGKFEGVEERLRDAERWLDTATPSNAPRADASDEIVMRDEAEFRRLPGTVAIHRAGLSLAHGDVEATVAHARRALAHLDPDDRFWRGAAGALLGLASWTSGDLETAYRSYSEGMASLYADGNVPDAIAGAITQADIRIEQGRLREARRIYERALRLAMETGDAVSRGAADMHIGLSALCREWNDLDAATQHVLRSHELGEHLGFSQNPYRWRVAMARIRVAQGEPDEALDLLDEAERRYVSDFLPNVRPIPAVRARVWLAQGRLGDALDWADERGLSAGDELRYLREFEHVTFARLLIARYRRDRLDRFLDEATGLLSRLLDATELGGRTGTSIEVLALIALAQDARGDLPGALVPLERALSLAESEGYVRLFIDEGAPMARLLSEARARGITPGYTDRLLASFDAGTAAHEPAPARAPGSPAQPLLEPLTDREIDVLHLIAAGLSNREISDRLFLALDTVKGHNRRIFGKLGVQRRTEAMIRARELGLL